MHSCISTDKTVVVSMRVSGALEADRLRQLGVWNSLVGRWPTGNEDLLGVVTALKRIAIDPKLMVNVTYRYPASVESSETVSAELLRLIVQDTEDSNSTCVLFEVPLQFSEG